MYNGPMYKVHKTILSLHHEISFSWQYLKNKVYFTKLAKDNELRVINETRMHKMSNKMFLNPFTVFHGHSCNDVNYPLKNF